MSPRELMRAAMSTSGLPVDELHESWVQTLDSLTPRQCELVAYLVAAAYSCGARDAGAGE